MRINEYGHREAPTIILLAPMMMSGKSLFLRMAISAISK